MSVHNQSSSMRLCLSTGSRIVLLNTYARDSRLILDQAARLGMLNVGWAWLVTDGTTAMVSDCTAYHRPTPFAMMSIDRSHAVLLALLSASSADVGCAPR